MTRLKVLVVDDAATVRRIVAQALSGDAGIVVVGEAATGREALDRLPALAPDLIVLDLEMPGMNGLETLAALRRDHPRLPVIVFSSATRHGAAATLDALWLGANDYVTKSGAGGPEVAVAHARAELVPRIRALCVPAIGAAAGAPRPPARTPPSATAELVAIGASTGGPAALATLLGALPAAIPAPIVVVQHMPPVFTGYLAEGLARRTPLAVREAADGDALEPGVVHLAPGDRHLTIAAAAGATRLRLDRSPHEHGCRPAVDPLLRSAARTFGARTLAVVLTGMGRDGRDGCEQVRAAGGQVLVQDEGSSVVWGMPGAVARAGLADAALPPEALAREIQRRVGDGRVRRAA